MLSTLLLCILVMMVCQSWILSAFYVWKNSISPLFLKEIFDRNRIWGWFFPLSIFKIVAPLFSLLHYFRCLLSAVIYLLYPICNVSFLPDTFKIFLVTLVLSNLMCFGVLFFLFLVLEIHWTSFNTWVYTFNQIWKFPKNWISSHISSNIYFLLSPYFFHFFWASVLHKLYWLNCSTTQMMLCCFFPSYFFLCVLFLIISIAMSSGLLIFSSSVFNILLIPFSIIFFISKSSNWFFFRPSLSLFMCMLSSTF